MPSGAINFSLGLASSGFLSALNTAAGRLALFVGGATSAYVSFGAAIRGVGSAISQAAGLQTLSKQTGESVSAIYRLQRAFQQVDISAASLGPMVFALQRALGGISEAGEPTAYVFRQLGLRIEDLRKGDAASQFLAIASSLKHLDQAAAAAAAAKIFGRAGARDFLALARDSGEFAAALAKASAQGAALQRLAPAADAITKGLANAREQVHGFFVGVASGIVPAIQQAVAALQSINLTNLGKQFGTILAGFTQAFREGSFSELIADSIKLGFDTFVSFAPAIFEKLGFFLIKAFETPLQYIQAGLEWVIERALNPDRLKAWMALAKGDLGAFAAFNAAADAAGATPFKEIIQEKKKEGLVFNFGLGEFSPSDINADANQRLAGARDQFRARWAAWMGNISSFAARGPSLAAASTSSTQFSPSILAAAAGSSATALEKMGFVMSGGASADPMRETARHTREMSATLKQIANNTSKPPPTPVPVNF